MTKYFLNATDRKKLVLRPFAGKTSKDTGGGRDNAVARGLPLSRHLLCLGFWVCGVGWGSGLGWLITQSNINSKSECSGVLSGY